MPVRTILLMSFGTLFWLEVTKCLENSNETASTIVSEVNKVECSIPNTTTLIENDDWKPMIVQIVNGSSMESKVDSTTTIPINYTTTIDPRFDVHLAQFPSPIYTSSQEITTTPMSTSINDDDDEILKKTKKKRKRKSRKKKKKKNKENSNNDDIDDEPDDDEDDDGDDDANGNNDCCKIKNEKINDEEDMNDQDDGEVDFDDENTAPIMLVLRSKHKTLSESSRKRIKKNSISTSSSSSNRSTNSSQRKKSKSRKKKTNKKRKTKVVELSKPVMFIAESIQNEQEEETNDNNAQEMIKSTPATTTTKIKADISSKAFNLTDAQIEKLADYFSRKAQRSPTALEAKSSAQFDLEPKVEYVKLNKGSNSGQIGHEFSPEYLGPPPQPPPPPPMPAMPVMANIYWRKIIYPPEPTILKSKTMPITQMVKATPSSSSSSSLQPSSDPYRPLINTRQPSSIGLGEQKVATTKSVKKYTIYYIQKNDNNKPKVMNEGNDQGDNDDEDDDEEERNTSEGQVTIDKIIKQIIEQNQAGKNANTKYQIHKVTDSKVVFPSQLSQSSKMKKIRLIPITEEARKKTMRRRPKRRPVL